jgi:hypothetical protein
MHGRIVRYGRERLLRLSESVVRLAAWSALAVAPFQTGFKRDERVAWTQARFSELLGISNLLWKYRLDFRNGRGVWRMPFPLQIFAHVTVT